MGKGYFSQLSVRKEEAGNPSVLNSSPTTKSSKAYLTATGLATDEYSVIPELVMMALAG